MGLRGTVNDLIKEGHNEVDLLWELVNGLYENNLDISANAYIIGLIEDGTLKKLGDRFQDILETNDNIQNYESRRYRQFVVDMHSTDYEVRHYKGRNFYEGPAVVTDNIQNIIRATSVPLQWDNYGRDEMIVYPR